MPTLRRPTVTLHYDDLGVREAPAALLMHSLLCDGEMFAHLAQELSRTHRVINLDSRGHGRSTPASRGYTLDEQCDDIPAVLDHAGVHSATLVGLSWGGMLAMRAAVFHPTRVAALALLDTSARPESPVLRAQYMAMAGSFLAVGLLPTVEARVRPLMFSDGFLAREPGAAKALTDKVRTWRREGVFQAVQAVAMRDDFSAQLGDVRVPTVVLVGDEDRATPVKRAEQLVGAIPGATLDIVRGAGHLTSVEQPELVAQAVRAFLERARQ